MEIRLLKAKPISYGGIRDLSSLQYIVIHYTGNVNDTARGNANYFATSNTRTAGAHYFVDDKEVWQSVPDIYTAWSVGGGLYEKEIATTGGGKYYGKCTNNNSVSIELCGIPPKENTIENALELTRILMQRYNIPKSNVIRHFDVTGKHCPAYWSVTDTNNKKWLTEFWNKIGGREDMTREETEKICNDMIYKYNEPQNKEIQKLREEVEALKDTANRKYEKIEDVPEWFRDATAKAVEKELIKGTGKGLGLNEVKSWTLTLLDRLGLLK
ncbi:MAG: N-acetylmuramoyl-L-alanine amidase [Firmicutes bacterium]|nr:N-acetylmuramoyl-L-alanine amidase [Bacillota bacterium]